MARPPRRWGRSFYPKTLGWTVLLTLGACGDTNAHRAHATQYLLSAASAIRRFSAANAHNLPKSIDELRSSPFYLRSEEGLDDWGREFGCQFKTLDGVEWAVLYSLGRDGVDGGGGLDEDTALWVNDADIFGSSSRLEP